MSRQPLNLPVSLLTEGSDSVSIPLIPTIASEVCVQALTQMRQSPRLDDYEGQNWRFVPVRKLTRLLIALG